MARPNVAKMATQRPAESRITNGATGGRTLEISLNADGFTLALACPPDPVGLDPAYVRRAVSLGLTIPGVEHRFQTTADFPLSDLARLRDWMLAHIQNLAHRPARFPSPIVEADTWVSLDLSIQVQCLDGDVEDLAGLLEGRFSIRVLINIGEDATAGHAVYGGFEGVVDVCEALSFCRAIDRCVNTS